MSGYNSFASKSITSSVVTCDGASIGKPMSVPWPAATKIWSWSPKRRTRCGVLRRSDDAQAGRCRTPTIWPRTAHNGGGFELCRATLEILDRHGTDLDAEHSHRSATGESTKGITPRPRSMPNVTVTPGGRTARTRNSPGGSRYGPARSGMRRGFAQSHGTGSGMAAYARRSALARRMAVAEVEAMVRIRVTGDRRRPSRCLLRAMTPACGSPLTGHLPTAYWKWATAR